MIADVLLVCHDADVTKPSDESTSRAIVAWTGYKQLAWPGRDESRVVEAFGTDALELMPLIAALEHDFYSSTAHHTSGDLSAMTEAATRGFRERHPGLSDEAVDALAWCYSFDMK